MVIKIQNKLYFILISIIIILIDQITKALIFNYYKIFANKDLIIFRIELIKNYGAAFNIFSGDRIFLSIVSFLFSVILICIILRKNTSNYIDLYSYSLLLGGSIGNGIDRVIRGYVIDFINLNFINFPVFNIADLSINIGFILILYSIFKIKK